MKKLIQKIVQLAMVAAVMLPSASIAENNATTWIGWGATFAGVGGYVWYDQSDEADQCAAINNNPQSLVMCTNQSDLEDNATLGAIIGLAGGGAMFYGFSQLNKGGTSFQVRPIPGGVAIERQGLSFSTNVKGESKLQKRWEF